MTAIAAEWPLYARLLGWLFLLTGTVAITWLAAAVRGNRWRRRAEKAEEALARLRAQRRQRRRPLIVPPGLFDEADAALAAEAETVLFGALTPQAEAAYRNLDRRHRGGWWQ